MGDEQYGIRDEVKVMADDTFYLPMTGLFAESFNFKNVATAITVYSPYHLKGLHDGMGEMI
jgi:tRNA G18 (ribose-2'-O)-methylase SpoU